MPSPTEDQILNSYLLVPARLPTIISLAQFTALFPRAQQSSPQVRSLYRDLQAQRNAIVDTVAARIETETREQGRVLRRQVLQARRAEDRGDKGIEATGLDLDLDGGDAEGELERMLFGHTSLVRPPKRHTLRSTIGEMETTKVSLEAEIAKLEQEEAELMEAAKAVVGNMSDLRYGRLANPKLPDEVMDGMKEMQEICKQKT